MPANRSEQLRRLPSIERVAAVLPAPPGVAVSAAREVVAARRAEILAGDSTEVGETEIVARATARARELAAGSLRPVINATGVILHTNLGRAPLAVAAAQAAAEIASGYSNLEYDLERGGRGSRHAHVEELLCELSGAEAAIAVNNNAAAVLLALSSLAADRQVITGRDSLIEIGGEFRIPDILAQSGAELIEVGTTNRTRIADYELAITAETAALLRVHQSNFRTVGFTEAVALPELCALGRERGIPVIDDLGSGALAPLGDEPLLRDSIAAGTALVCCSADKLLGGPQAGIVAGRETEVERARKHPLARALRLDKLQLAALEATLRLHRDQGPSAIPALAMLTADQGELRERAEQMVATIGPAASLAESSSRPGGGTLPTTELEGPVCAVDLGAASAEAILDAMRAHQPPVIGRVEAGRVMLDPRTMSDAEARTAALSVRDALA